MGSSVKEEMSQETKNFIKFYCSKWRSKSIFQVLLQYRAARHQDFVQLSQQVLLISFNQIRKSIFFYLLICLYIQKNMYQEFKTIFTKKNLFL